jgi:site-specific recombinase XerD
MLLDENMQLIEPPCAWLMYIALVRGRTRSSETWRTYGEVLYDWWQTLEANHWSWDHVGTAEVAAYRDRMLHRPSDHTGRGYARSTINTRLRILALFYKWCRTTGLIDHIPFAASDVALGRSRPPGFLAAVDAGGGIQTVNDLTVRHLPTLPRPLAPQVIRDITARMGARDRLIVEWAVTTGVRRMEVAALRLSVLPHGRKEPMRAVRIEKTKGGRARWIYPPGPLVDRTWAYVREERAVAVRRGRKSDAHYAEPDRVFLTSIGGEMKPRRVGAMFSAAAAGAGIDARFHALRHSFAGAMLRFLQRQASAGAEINPLLTLQTLLGHAELTTTAIYLRMVAVDLTAIEPSVDDLYNAVL